MIPGLDSATPPTAVQATEARAGGVPLWSGYLATSGAGGSAFGLLRVWTQAEFEVARSAGNTPIAFCSGWDDPVGCQALAAAWRVRLCLDVESGIRGDGTWVQSWLDASGAGLYGNASVHWEASGPRRAAFHIVSAYLGYDPQTTYYGPQPPGPHGWQWLGSHQEFGAEVDRGWYDDWFGGEMTDEEHQALMDVRSMLAFGNSLAPNNLPLWGIAVGDGTAKTDEILAQGAAILAAVKAIPGAGGASPTQLAAALRAAAHQLDGQ